MASWNRVSITKPNIWHTCRVVKHPFHGNGMGKAFSDGASYYSKLSSVYSSKQTGQFETERLNKLQIKSKSNTNLNNKMSFITNLGTFVAPIIELFKFCI